MLFAKWRIDKDWLKKIKNLSIKKDIVTLDIFDTCITRDVDSPVDIFAKVEEVFYKQSEYARGFAEAREKAEQITRNTVWEKSRKGEVTYDEIYEQIPLCIDMPAQEIKRVKELELKIEKESLYAVPDLIELTNYFVKNKIPYSFVSDTYFSQVFLSEVLLEKGFHGWEKIIASSEYGKTKAAGNIWSIPYLNNKNILHIGDNVESDLNKPRKYGLDTVLYDRAASELRTGAPLTPAILAFSQQHRLCELEFRSNPQYKKANDFDQKQMQLLGESFGALVLGAFVLWLKERARKNGITHLVFFARDGYLSRKAWQVMKAKGDDSSITDSYLCVSRKVLRLASGYLESRPDFIPEDILNFLSFFFGNISVRDALNNIEMNDENTLHEAGIVFNDIDTPVDWLGIQEPFKNFLRQKSARLYEVLKAHYDGIVGYFKQEGILNHKKVGIVDMGWNGTMQRSFNQICVSASDNFQCCGFYYGLWRWASGNRYLSGYMESAFFSEFDSIVDFEKNTQGVDVIEELNIPDSGTTYGYLYRKDSYIALCDASALEHQQYKQFIEPFQCGALTAFKSIMNSGKYGCLDIGSLTKENVNAAYRLLFLSPTDNEVLTLTKIKHGASFNHRLVGISDLPIPVSKQQASDECNMGWSVGAIRRWQILSDQNNRSMLTEFAKSRFSFFTTRELKTFDRK